MYPKSEAKIIRFIMLFYYKLGIGSRSSSLLCHSSVLLSLKFMLQYDLL